MRRLKTLAVIGAGLIGGSFAMALRRAGAVTNVVGFDRDARAMERATELGVIDTAADSVSGAVRGADLIVVAVPVRASAAVLRDIGPAMDAGAVVTDVGSTKGEVVRTAAGELRERFARFVPGHPIAGRETSGVESASADLFRGARVVLTPGAATAADASELVRTAWEALVSELAARDDAAELLGFAGGGFRDFTRIAASSPEMWRDIALQNRAALLDEIDRYGAQLAVFRALIDKGDAPGLERLMTEARASRESLKAGTRRGSAPE
jgi:prephenate dehydrogenase